MAAPTPEQLRQRIGVVSLSRFLAMPDAERAKRLAGWRADAEAQGNNASPDVRWSAKARLQRCAEWSAAAELAAARGIAVLGITHLTKGTAGRDPVERVNGSLAFGALARVVLMAAKPKAATNPDDPRLFFRAKSNIGPDGGGIEYFLRQGEVEGYPGVSSSYALFGAPLSGSAHELMARAEADPDDGSNGRQPSRLDDACEVLRAILADGPVPSTETIRQAKAAGVKADTLSKARERLGVKARKRPEDGVWIMSLPPDPSGGATAGPGQGPEEPEEPEDRQGPAGSVFPRRAGDPPFGLKDHGVFGLSKEPILQIVPILDTGTDAPGSDAEEWL